MRHSLPLLLLACVLAMSARAEAGKLSVVGTGTVSVVPDVAKVYLSVTVTKPTAAAACNQAASATAAVRDAVQGVPGIKPEDITTENFNVYPNYNYPPEGGPQITGYVCSQSMVVKINDVDNNSLAAVIDAAVKAGGNDLQVSQVAMDLSPALRKSATDEARTLAVEDATATADLLAKSAKVTLGAIRSIADTNQAAPPPVPMGAGASGAPMADAAASTPVQIGTTDVVAAVAMEYAIS